MGGILAPFWKVIPRLNWIFLSGDNERIEILRSCEPVGEVCFNYFYYCSKANGRVVYPRLVYGAGFSRVGGSAQAVVGEEPAFLAYSLRILLVLLTSCLLPRVSESMSRRVAIGS
jgi:hypothetical protein